MKTKTTLTFMLVTCFSLMSMGQKLTGRAVYKSAMKIEIDMEAGETGPGGADQEEVQKALARAMQKDYELIFSGQESNYKEMPSLGGAPQVQSGGLQINIKMSNGVLYKNIDDGIYLEEEDLFGKPFLIDDKLKKYEWQLHDEYKQIGQYTCQKATFSETRKRMEFSVENGEQSQKAVIDTVKYTAWYTPQIPVKHGPSVYSGLPGLIMEISGDDRTLICSKITLNPSEPIEIVIPEKGKRATREEYNKLQQEKFKEMQEQYKGEGENNVIIKIGG